MPEESRIIIPHGIRLAATAPPNEMIATAYQQASEAVGTEEQYNLLVKGGESRVITGDNNILLNINDAKTTFWYDLVTAMNSNVQLLKRFYEFSMVGLPDFIASNFNQTTGEITNDNVLRIMLEPYEAEQGVYKTLSSIAPMWFEQFGTTSTMKGFAMTSDLYMLLENDGREEFMMHLMQLKSAFNSSQANFVNDQLHRCQVVQTDVLDVVLRYNNIDTIEKAMTERVFRVAACNKRQNGLEDIIKRASVYYSHKQLGAPKKLLLAHGFYFNEVHNHPESIQFNYAGNKAMSNRSMLNMDMTMDGLKVETFNTSFPGTWNMFDTKNNVFLRRTGSKSIMFDLSSKLKDKKKFISGRRNIWLTNADDNDFREYSIRDALHHVAEFVNEDCDEHGEIDFKVIQTIFKNLTSNVINVWAEMKLERTIHNLKTFNQLVILTDKNKYACTTRFGMMSQHHVPANSLETTVETIYEFIFGGNAFRDNDLKVMADLFDKHSKDKNLLHTWVNFTKKEEELRDLIQTSKKLAEKIGTKEAFNEHTAEKEKNKNDLTVLNLKEKVRKAIDALFVTENSTTHAKLVSNYKNQEATYTDGINVKEMGQTTSNMDKWLEKAGENRNILKRFCLETFLHAFVCLQSIDMMYDNNVNIPLTTNFFRLEHSLSECVMLTNGRSLGEFRTTPLEVTNVVDTIYRQVNIDVKQEMSVSVTYPENVYVEECCRVVASVSGNGGGLFNFRKMGNRQEKDQQLRETPWIVTLGSYAECLPDKLAGRPVTVPLDGIDHANVWIRELPQGSPIFSNMNTTRRYMGQEIIHLSGLLTPYRYVPVQNRITISELNDMKNAYYCNEQTVKYFNPETDDWEIKLGKHEFGTCLPGLAEFLEGGSDVGEYVAQKQYREKHKRLREEINDIGDV